MNAASTIYVQDHQVAVKQREGYRCTGRSVAGDMIMRLPAPRCPVVYRPNAAALRQQIVELEAKVAQQRWELGVLREQVAAIKKALPESHPILCREAKPRGTKPQLAKLREAVAEAFDVPLARLCGKSRELPVSRARHAFFTLARERTGFSLPVIAQALGCKDHTSVIHGINRTRDHWTLNADFVKRYAQAEALADA